MKLKKLIQDLALGELQGTPLVETSSFQIQEKFLPTLIQVINRSLEHFYSVFPLQQGQVLIKLMNGVSHYYLDDAHAMTNPDSTAIKYIMDTDAYPFPNDVLQITGVSTLEGCQLAIDDAYSAYGVLLPQPDCIHVPNDLDTTMLSVVYQAAHPEIPLTEGADSNFDVYLPKAMQSAFMAYVACLYLQNMGGNKHNDSNAFFAKYQTQMELLKQQGFGVVSQSGTNIKPYLREWI